ncbi:putative malate dehydrogenase 1B [Girardinichthys multiradiatus]|uniref:putative malate dehydrogenase 1B n=1 Tax=Girardinichthys multiradiatus TaxID=208333 RepID=UPI001FACFD9D|nr:putative malate dehydrogenase 1B [Girardinichthys multiradiatus]
MAKFVLAGKADCPYYAKAELLADVLQRSLPNFRVHKISVLPAEWKEWLESTCERNGWKHNNSPLVWRELVEQGGKGMLLGGFSDFLNHCQDYYGITSDMSTDVMQRIAAENLETQSSLTAEERHCLSLIQPLHVWITGALSLTCQILIPSLLSAEVFPKDAAIALHLLDLEGDEEEMQRLKMDVEDLAPSVLLQVIVHTDLDQAFHEASIILLLDDFRNDAGNETKLRVITEHYREYGHLIDGRANKQVKVIVCGDSFVNLRCSLLVENAPSINSHQFVATATQLENEARAVLAKKMRVRPSDVTDVIVWGNISGSFIIDLQRAKVFNYRGAIRGPDSFPQSVLQILHDRKWLETEFQQQVRLQRAVVVSKTGHAAAISATNGILRVLKAWHGAYGQDEVFSVGVLCTGFFKLPNGIILSVPVTCMDGKWSVLLDVTVDNKLQEELKLCAKELLQVFHNKAPKTKQSTYS